MKTLALTLIAGLVLTFAAGEAQAQRFYYRNTYGGPTPFPGNYNYSVYYNGPYSYQSASTGVYPTFYGYNSYYTTTTSIRPVYMGPYVSVIWDPTTLTYRYGGGYTNTPNYSYYVGPNPYPLNPYLPYPYLPY